MVENRDPVAISQRHSVLEKLERFGYHNAEESMLSRFRYTTGA